MRGESRVPEPKKSWRLLPSLAAIVQQTYPFLDSPEANGSSVSRGGCGPGSEHPRPSSVWYRPRLPRALKPKSIPRFDGRRPEWVAVRLAAKYSVPAGAGVPSCTSALAW